MTEQTLEQKPELRKPELGASDESEAPNSPIRATLYHVGEMSLLAASCMRALLRSGVDMGELLRQMSAIGADSIWLVAANNMATGSVFAMYTAMLALQIGFPEFVGGTIAYAFLNEMGPLLAGTALASRCGAAIAAEIGSMKVTEQIDALTAMAVSPVRYLVVPRVLAATLMLPLLTVVADIVGIFGGYLAAGFYGVPHAVFLESVHKYASTTDLYRGLIKAAVFGFLIGLAACQQGLKTRGGAVGVGRATTSSVVICVVLIFISDAILARLLTQGVMR